MGIDWIEQCRQVLGEDGVVCDRASLMTYENDAFTLIRAAPQAVIFPRDTRQAAQVMRLLHDAAVSVVPRGAGTSLAGGTVAVGGGACVCTSRMRDILAVNLPGRWARVQAGVANLRLSRELAASGYQFAPDPSSQMVSTIGGNAATNAGGPHTLKLGVTTNHVLGLTLVLPDGQVAELGCTPVGSGAASGGPVEDSAGLDLRALAVGSEGTLGLITEVVVRLARLPAAVWTTLAVFDGVDEAAEAIGGIIAAGIIPAALEMIDRLTLNCVEAAFHFGFPPDAGAVLIIELDGIAAGLEAQAARVAELCRRHCCRELRTADSEEKRAELWKCRKKAFGAYGRLGKACCTQDGVVPRTRIPEILRFIDDVSKRYGITIANMMHAGDGNIHPVLMYDESSPDEVRRTLAASRDILAECVRLGGSVTGEHGIGIEKTEHLHAMFSAADLAAQSAVREAFDPQHRCNPHKVLASGAACLERLLPADGIPA